MRSIIVLLIAASLMGCGGTGHFSRIIKEEESKRQAVEAVVPEVLRDPLPYRVDRYEAVGFSDEMLLGETEKNRAMADMIAKLSISTKAQVYTEAKSYLGSHPVLTKLSGIDTTLSLSEVFFESVSDIITTNVMEGLVVSMFWRDRHGLIGRKGMTYCYGFIPKSPELLELQALQLSVEEMEKLKDFALRKGMAEQTRQRVDKLVKELKAQTKGDEK